MSLVSWEPEGVRLSFLHLSVRFLLTGTPISNAFNHKDGQLLPGAGREGLWGELAQRLWAGSPPSSCSASLVTWPHPQWGGRGADLSHLLCSQTSPVPSPGDVLIPAHRQDGELPGDTHTTSFTTEASPWSLVWDQLLPRPVTHARGTDAE